MEKRDIIVIAVALLIVLVMAMYIKPLVTGKEAKLIPDEISSLFKKEDISNDTIAEKPVNKISEFYSKPSYTSISPNESNINSKTTIEIEGKEFKSQMEIQVFSVSGNFTLNTSLEDGKLVGRDAVFPEKGDWIVKIFDPDLNITYNTQHVIHVQPVPTPEPTWDGTPKPLTPIKSYDTENYYTGRSYPVNPIKKEVKMKIYSDFGGVRSVDTAPINIPYPYWDINYTVDFQTEIANPEDDELFEFNRKYQEPLVIYEGEPVIYYEKNSFIPTLLDVKTVGSESETEFRPSKDKVIAKKYQKEPNSYPPYEVATESFRPSLVEAVGYKRPFIKIKVINEDDKTRPAIEITPSGGIDPLQWDEGKHKSEAEKIMTQKGSKEEFDSEKYQKNWEEKWKTIKDPRPWNERIYGAGNYSFQVFVQSIDSYNIKIEVPELEAGHEKESDNLYSNETENIRNRLNLFKDEYNNILSSDTGNLTSFFSGEKLSDDEIRSIISEYIQKRAGGLIIKDINLNDIHIIGKFDSEGYLREAYSAMAKGSMTLERDKITRTVPVDADLLMDRSEWRLRDPITIRI
ncbi:MAG: hypothetical protein GX268_12655 [Methanomicrobiales archaeon]|nr:hypothetical protein [Methanomicrobiales archaeon]